MKEALKEKLVKLIHYCTSCEECRDEDIADHLIANGATIPEWISVQDGLPELIPCDAGTAYSEAVNVLTTGRKVIRFAMQNFGMPKAKKSRTGHPFFCRCLPYGKENEWIITKHP